jgi:ComF family protein
MNYTRLLAGLSANTRRALFFLREYFFPAGCALCGRDLAGAVEAWYGLCETCRASLADDPPSGEIPDHCDLCGRPLVSEQDRCLPCRNRELPGFDRIKVLFPYAGTYRCLLNAYKFGKNLALGNFFAEKIREALKDPALPRTAPVVPVPPRPGKIRETGWDQVEYLAGLLERNREAEIFRCLERLPSQVQKKLNREDRATNLLSRIRLTTGAPRTAILIDDVMTTGSTMDVCASVLKAGGAAQVFGICLFYS